MKFLKVNMENKIFFHKELKSFLKKNEDLKKKIILNLKNFLIDESPFQIDFKWGIIRGIKNKNNLIVEDIFLKNGEDIILLLFDIDGTILTTFGQAKRAFEFALMEIFGTKGPIDSFSWSGKLDSMIVYELMEGAGIKREEIEKNLKKTLKLYEKTLKKIIEPERVYLKEGVVKVIKDASKDKNILLGLCTGNTPIGAKIKLSSVGLWKYFPIGSFGTEGRRREELPPIALRKAQRWVGMKIKKEKVFVIGDSPSDIESAKANCFFSISVASGFHKREELEKYKPDLLLDDLKKGEDIFWRFVKNGVI